MWITDNCYRDVVESWELSPDGITRHRTVPYTPSFYLHFEDPAVHWELLEALESDYGAVECTFRTVHGDCDGYYVPAGREVAMAIERQTGFHADLYNVDLRPDHRHLAREGRVPCCNEIAESRFSPELPSFPFRTIEVHIRGIPWPSPPRALDPLALGSFGPLVYLLTRRSRVPVV